jgi:hypothetical protein
VEVVLQPVGCYELLEVSLEVKVVVEQLHYLGWAVEVETILDLEVAAVQTTCVHP